MNRFKEIYLNKFVSRSLIWSRCLVCGVEVSSALCARCLHREVLRYAARYAEPWEYEVL